MARATRFARGLGTDSHQAGSPLITASGARWLVVALCWLALATGCESLQKKFTRKSKPEARASPIISFQDYSQTITPLDRYRKHYAIFEYWNAQLLDTLGAPSVNPKRAQRSSAEALRELKTLQGLLQEGPAAQLEAIITERAKVDQQLHRRAVPSELDVLRRTLERQTRQINRAWFWRAVEDRLEMTPTPHASPD